AAGVPAGGRLGREREALRGVARAAPRDRAGGVRVTGNELSPEGMGVVADDASPDPAGHGLPGMQREEVDAALRGVAGAATTVDLRGLAVATEAVRGLVEHLADDDELTWRVWRDEVTV